MAVLLAISRLNTRCVWNPLLHQRLSRAITQWYWKWDSFTKASASKQLLCSYLGCSSSELSGYISHTCSQHGHTHKHHPRIAPPLCAFRHPEACSSWHPETSWGFHCKPLLPCARTKLGSLFFLHPFPFLPLCRLKLGIVTVLWIGLMEKVYRKQSGSATLSYLIIVLELECKWVASTHTKLWGTLCWLRRNVGHTDLSSVRCSLPARFHIILII
jgi:hypothetical protein